MISFIKKSFVLIAFLITLTILSACGGEEAVINNDLKSYDGGDFTINIPSNWNILTPSEFYPQIPKETLVAFTAPEAMANGFFINVNITKEQNLPPNTTSADYGQANIRLANQNLTDYTEIQQEVIDDKTVHIFTARLNPSEPLLRFIQFYAIDGTDGYIVSGGMPVETDEEIRDLIGAIVISFQVKNDSITTE